MSEIVQTTAPEEPTGPSFELGSVNVDSLKDILNRIGVYLSFADEASKVAYHEQINVLDIAGDPNAPKSEAGVAEVSDLEAQVAKLEAELAAAKANAPAAENQGGGFPPPENAGGNA